MKPSISFPRLGSSNKRKSSYKKHFSFCCGKSPSEEIEPNRTIQVHTTVQTDSLISKCSAKEKKHYKIEKHDESVESIEDIQSPSRPFRFLDLPRQIRDMIYRCTLQQKRSILHVAVDPESEEYSVHGRNFDWNARNMRPPENVFELVCKQLREETRGLVQERHREIRIHEKTSAFPSSYAFWTIVTEPTFHSMQNQIKTIYVRRCISISRSRLERTTVEEMFECLAEFKFFCEENPEIDVIIRFGGVLGVSSKYWFQWVAGFQELVRGSSRLMLPQPRRHVLPECSQSFDDLRVLPFLSHNLRFSVLERYPEAEVEDDLRYYHEQGQMSKDEAAELKVWAGRVFENGM